MAFIVSASGKKLNQLNVRMMRIDGRDGEPFAKAVVDGLLGVALGLGGVRGFVRLGWRMKVGPAMGELCFEVAIREGVGEGMG